MSESTQRRRPRQRSRHAPEAPSGVPAETRGVTAQPVRHDYSATEAEILAGEEEISAWMQRQRRLGRPPETDDDLPEGLAFPDDPDGVVVTCIPKPTA